MDTHTPQAVDCIEHMIVICVDSQAQQNVLALCLGLSL
jgi:hypothetical protein